MPPVQPLPHVLQLWQDERQHFHTVRWEERLHGGVFVARVIWSRQAELFRLVESGERVALKILRSGFWRIEPVRTWVGQVIRDEHGQPIDRDPQPLLIPGVLPNQTRIED
jgi:hypothetical protein